MTRRRGRPGRASIKPDVREVLRKDAAEVEMQLALQERPHDVRMTLPKIAWEEYEEVPDYVDAYYITGPRLFLVDLPALGGEK